MDEQVHPTDCTLSNIMKVCLKLNICSSDWLYLVKHHKGLLEVEYLFIRQTVPCQTSWRFAWSWIPVHPTDCTLSNIMKLCLMLNICSSDWMYLVKHHKGLLEVEYLFIRLTVPCQTLWRFAWSWISVCPTDCTLSNIMKVAWSWISVHATDCTLSNIIKVCLKLNICSSDWLYLVKHHKGLLEVEYLFIRLTIPCQTS